MSVKRCYDCSFISCICGKQHPEKTCPAECGHALWQHGRRGCGAKDGGHDVYCSCVYEPAIVKEAARQDLILSMPCVKHRRYQAKRPPRVNCENCWRIWIALNPR